LSREYQSLPVVRIWLYFSVNVTYRITVTATSNDSQSNLYFLRGDLARADAEQLCKKVLADPVSETFYIETLNEHKAQPDYSYVEVGLLPGVTDSVAENLLRTARQLGFKLDETATGWHYKVHSNQVEQRALELANPVIHRYSVNTPIQPAFLETSAEWQPVVEHIDLRALSNDELLNVSRERRLSMDLAEMQALQHYYQKEKRAASDIELEMFAQTWSEHCVHKTFKADITTSDGQTVHGLLKTYIAAATHKLCKPWVRSAFVDNAGVIKFDETFDLAFKVETHNHPSALEPFGGANTGVGGVIRDVLAMGAKPIANTDILCFGPLELESVPEGVLPPRRVYDGVIKGIEDYSNKMGIPTVNGAVVFHKGYTSNPLVYCGCLGVLPASKKNSTPLKATPGDLIVTIGGHTGRDGLRGATFSSLDMDTSTTDIASASVQIGNPITEKQIQEVILKALSENLYSAMTDCGAGGFSSAVGEMAQGLGALVKLGNIKTKYPGLHPWELWLSEAQERMVLAVPKKNVSRLEEICTGQDVELTVLGEFTDSGRLELYYNEKRVGELSLDFLHDGIPRKKLTAYITKVQNEPLEKAVTDDSYTDVLHKLLAHPNIRSKESIIRTYDHEIKGGTVIKPLVGAASHGPSDASVLAPNPNSSKGVSLSNGICPQYGERDPYAMTFAAIDEAVRNAIAVGADPDRIAILDNFCWGNPTLPDRLGSLLETSRACFDAALLYGTPFVSGKDSLYNEYTDEHGQKHAIPGTLLISAVGIVPDLHETVTMDFKKAGDLVFVLGETREELGASHYALLYNLNGGTVPQPTQEPLESFRKLHQAIQNGWIQACHDCSEGGLAVALAEMSIAGRLGASWNALSVLPNTTTEAPLSTEATLFGETLSRFVLEIVPEHEEAVLHHFAGHSLSQVGTVNADNKFIAYWGMDETIETSVDVLETYWRGDIAVTPSRQQHKAALTRFNIKKDRRVAILHANGTNRDHDAARAIEISGGTPEIIHMNELSTKRLQDYHMLVVPGGFSFGDDLGAGVLWALQLREHFGDALKAFVESQRPVLGICNGFQTLAKAGIFEDTLLTNERTVTLYQNERRHFECRWVTLQANPGSPCIFTQDTTFIDCPVAHGEGRVLVKDDATLRRLEHLNLIALTYAGGDYPHNPNGSVANIAGLTNKLGNVLGLMPHPENYIFDWQFPRYSRGETGFTGLTLFQNGLKNA
jgi:phosphoribosylformylglycinamidine synthase II/phosphoribosylformylglycinamidine synthase I